MVKKRLTGRPHWNRIWLAAAMLYCSCWLRRRPPAAVGMSGGGGGGVVLAFSPAPTRISVARPLSPQWRTTPTITVTKAPASIRRSFSQSKSYDDDEEEENEDNAIQWELFNKYHNKGSWKGIWTTYDYMGDVSLETIASVDYQTQSQTSLNSAEKVSVSHTIVVGATKSDCDTCFDSMETRTIPVTVYTPNNLNARKTRLGACGMVIGPSLLRNGAMATELVLAHGDGRVRVIFQHAPVWEKGVQAGTGPPQGLKLYRCLVSREAVRDSPPTAAQEASNPPPEGNPIFDRPVPPPDWHKKWAGTSWTWGPEAGNRGWSLEELEQDDAWQANMPVELWNLRLPGGLFVQTPRVVPAAQTGMLRMAWMPRPESLLRLEVGVLALQAVVVPDDEDVEILAPPSLVSYRCDVLRKVGELEGMPSFVEQMRQEELEKQQKIPSTAAKTIQVRQTAPPTKEDRLSDDDDDNDSDLKAIQDALQL